MGNNQDRKDEEYIMICNDNLSTKVNHVSNMPNILYSYFVQHGFFDEAVEYSPESSELFNYANFKTHSLNKLLENFNIGFEPSFIFDDGEKCPAIIIPTDTASYTAVSIRDDKCVREGDFPFLNFKNLSQYSDVYITETEMDALSIMNANQNFYVMSIGGLESVDKFLSNKNVIDKIRNFKENFMVCMNNNSESKAAAKKIVDKLRELKLKAYAIDLCGSYPNVNSAYSSVERSNIFNNPLVLALVRARRNILYFGNNEEARKVYMLQNSCNKRFERFINKIEANKTYKPISTGFSSLDQELGGGLFSGLYIIGAISSLGKSAFALQIADKIAKAGHDVMFFALEMSIDELISRSISREIFENIGDAPAEKIARTARDILYEINYDSFTQESKDAIQKAVESYKSYNEHLFIMDHTSCKISNIVKLIEKHCMIMNTSPVVIIDYLQLLETDNENSSDKQNVDKSVIALKKISQEFNLPVIAISSLNRASYNKDISFEAFKESGAIEYSGDLLLGLQFEEKKDVNEEKQKNPRKIEAVILKHRNGPSGGKIKLNFYAPYNYFEEENV